MTLLVLGGCAESRYYWQSLSGHFQLMQAARPVDDWLADPTVTHNLKQRLQLAQEIRQFAVTELHLPDNASYRRYADLQRRHVVWNVVAAPEFSLKLKTWCFPVAGCVGYRGYFAQEAAQNEADSLRAQGLEVSVYGVPAYSTLGWMNWLGGDPLLNTFIAYPDGELARMVFHELAHQVLYVPDDTLFNESFATAVERLGSASWLAQQATPVAQRDYAIFDARRQQFRALSRATRAKLEQIYKENSALAPVNNAQTAMKFEAMNNFRHAYASLKTSWGGFSGYDTWVAQANNAAFGAQAAYDELVPGFEALFVQQERDWPRFYDAVRQLAQRPKEERSQLLKQWATPTNI
ncbi:MAG: putative zinc protease [Comamonadaceae bacterium]|nr:MAG: putative zinc protease [Comamonadaceae bacterium]